ncbi:MAG: adenine deaminase C-terminal domain-containing protein [Thermoproteota archaeon]|nr:adenine deaminase C-terminal domain-containing protein [Thermoproteota archaeon]
MGDDFADLVLVNCSLVNVYTKEIQKKIQIAITNGRIAFVGTDASHTIGPKTKTLNVRNKFVSPSFVDPHIHIDHFIMPSEFVKKSLLCGVTTLFPDSIDIVSVCGYKGFKEFVNLTKNLPMRFFHTVPGGLPVDKKFSHGKTLSLKEEKSAIKIPSVVGLGEVFSWTKVTKRDSKTMKSLQQMHEENCIINGHTAGASGKKLNAYVSSGIFSCHEPINFDQVIERLRLGMWIMIREGSIRRDLREILPVVISHGTYTNRLMFCSDGVDPVDLSSYGHIDHCARSAIKLGLDPIDAISMASKNCFDYYNLGQQFGGIAPGKMADILILDDLKKIKINSVLLGGKTVVSNGKLTSVIKKPKIPKWITSTVKLVKFSENDFSIKSLNITENVNAINLKTEIVTEKTTEDLNTKNGNVSPSFEKDIWKVAAFDRTFGTKKHTIGFLKNFGAEIGAFASSWSFHENDLIVIGSNEKDMALACNKLSKSKGGMIVVKDGKTLASMPLQLAGIISTNSVESVSKQFLEISSSMTDSGCKFKKPHLIPVFLPFLALPDIRILYSGIVDVKKRVYINPVNS